VIEEFVQRFDANRDVLRARFKAKRPEFYADIVKAVVETVGGDEYGAMDPTRIHEIDDGNYQGTLVYVIGGGGYQPYDYWYVRVYYGSCSGCDTLQAIQGCAGDEVSDEEADDTMTLALQILQRIKKMDDEEE